MALEKWNPQEKCNERVSLSLALVVLLFGSALAGASTLITKQQAEQDALMAVGGGNVTLGLSETVDFFGSLVTTVERTPVRSRSRS